MNEILEQFKKLGMDASFHFADDTGSEWGLAYRDQEKALDLYLKNPSLQEEMKEIAKGFIFSLERELKYKKDRG